MMYRNHLSAILCIVILAGCAASERYALSTDDQGRLVRLDTRTGEVMLIEDGQLTPEQDKAAPEAKPRPEPPKAASPKDGKAWPVLTLPELGNTRAALTTHWFNGKLHFGIELYPFSKRLKLVNDGYYRNSSLSLAFNDNTGKRAASTIISAIRLKHTTNKIRKMKELSVEGVILMTRQKYDSLADWQLRWNP